MNEFVLKELAHIWLSFTCRCPVRPISRDKDIWALQLKSHHSSLLRED